MDLTGIGLYTIQEAARFTKAATPEIRRWLYGYTRQGRVYEPLWRPQVDYPDAISFHDLLELKLVNLFAKEGVRLSVIRATIEAARRLLGTDYPLTSHRFLSDGRRIFYEAIANDPEPLTDLAAQQRVIDSVIRPALFAGIEFSEGGSAQRWFPDPKRKSVVLDPKVGFGAPTLTNYGIRTDTIAAALRVERSAARVAQIYDIPRAAVTAADAFERRHAA